MTHAKHDLLSMAALSASDIDGLLTEARRLKARRRPEQRLAGKTLGMIFEKPSTRTSVSFAVAMVELGGHALTLDARNLQIGRGETMADTARTLSRYLSGLMMRANRHADVEELALHADIPVINGLTDKEHPCQVLADLQTALEAFRLKKTADLRRLRFAYVGDGNNMTHSWMLAAGVLGLQFVAATPAGYAPDADVQKKAAALARASGGSVEVARDPAAAVRGADVVYTDVWTSMGQEAEAEKRRSVFRPYQINDQLLSRAAPRAVVMHCLPAHRGEEITAAVLEGPRSVVFDQAENRLHVQKAVLLHCLGGGRSR
ncbi:MAG TPA: ornithine carbamoyltransferase [Elusimicrobiota bacterium]|nr:ornithine carbamoyltransferase [Elusimicrobiota bacterium]HMZ26165.1 ornithine carbamoyltransferase [Elusimicrobiota bacterium]HNI56216.1 ornithine carbamoyltransferase [Elusimicrobiota bacterium]